MTIQIELLTPAREAAYRRFLAANPRALIYASLAFRDFLRAVAGGAPRYLLALRAGEVVGVLPYFCAEHPEHGVLFNSLPWYGSYGACTLADEADDAARRALLQGYAEALDRPDLLAATLILDPWENRHLDLYAAALRPRYTDRRIGQVKTLPEAGADLDDRLLYSFRKKTRNLVRKALKQGFALEVTDAEWAWRFLHTTHTENIAALGGRAKPWAHFEAMRAHIPAAWRQIYVARLEGEAVAALLLLYYHQTVEYITPVIKHAYRPRQPLSFLIFHAMRGAVEAGYRRWNWGGTWLSQKSLHRFKAGWGADDYPYTYLVNTGAEATIRAHLQDLQAHFAYYYIFPYSQL